MCLKLSPAHFKASVSCLMQSSIPPFSQQNLLLGRWSHGSYQIPSSPLSSPSSWVGWGTVKGKWQSSLLHGWVREQSSLCRPVSVVFAASLAHSIEQDPSAGLAWGICVDSLKGFLGVLCPEWLSVMGFSLPELLPHRAWPSSRRGYSYGSTTKTAQAQPHLWCSLNLCRPTEWYICHAMWSECSLLFLCPTFSSCLFLYILAELGSLYVQVLTPFP